MTRLAAAGLILCCSMLIPVVSAQNAPPPQNSVPDHLLYWNSFRAVVHFNKVADEAALQGQDKSSLRTLVARKAGLSDAEGEILRRIATQCAADVAAQDAKAATVIARFRDRYPYGIISAWMPPPTPPSELADLQRERNNIILLAREQLRLQLGEEAFARFDKHVKRNVTDPPPKPARPPAGGGL